MVGASVSTFATERWIAGDGGEDGASLEMNEDEDGPSGSAHVSASMSEMMSVLTFVS